MDMWLVWVAVFSVGVWAGPLLQTGDGPNKPFVQEQAAVDGRFQQFQNRPNTPGQVFTAGTGFSRNVPGSQRLTASQFQRPLRTQGSISGFSRQNQNVHPRGFFPGHGGRGSVEVVRVVHPSLTEGFGSLEELGISHSGFITSNGNMFGNPTLQGGFGGSSAEFGLGTSDFSNNAFHSRTLNSGGFGNQNFGNNGFNAPIIRNPNFSGSGFSPPSFGQSGFRRQNFVPSRNNFARGGLGGFGFGQGFNTIPFRSGPPIGGGFSPVGFSNGQFGQGSFPSSSFDDGGFIPNVPSQQTRVILHSVPVVVSIVNDTHGSVTLHNQVQQGFRNSPETGGFSQGEERNTAVTGTFGESGSSNLLRTGGFIQGGGNNSPGTGGSGLGVGINPSEFGSFNQNKGTNLANTGTLDTNFSENKAKIGIPVALSEVKLEKDNPLALQAGAPPTAEALVLALDTENSAIEVKRAGFPTEKEGINPNLIPLTEVTKSILTEDQSLTEIPIKEGTTVSPTSNIPSSSNIASAQASSSSSNAASTQAGGLSIFVSESSSTSVEARESAGSQGQPTLQEGQTSDTQSLDQVSRVEILPIPEALASFAAIGPPPFSKGIPMAEMIRALTNSQRSSSAKTTVPVTSSAADEITTLRPPVTDLGITPTIPLSSLSGSIISTSSKATSSDANIQTSKQSSSSQSPSSTTLTQLLVLPLSNLNTVTNQNLPEEGLVTVGNGRIMRIGDPVSIVPNIVKGQIIPLQPASSTLFQPLIHRTTGHHQQSTQLGTSQVLGTVTSSTQLGTSQVSGGSISSTQLGTSEVPGDAILSKKSGLSHESGAIPSAQLGVPQVLGGAISSAQLGIPQVLQGATSTVSVPQLTTSLPPTVSSRPVFIKPQPTIVTNFPTTSIAQSSVTSNIQDTIARLPKITETIPVGLPAITTIGASIPPSSLPQSIQSAANPNNIPLSITPSPFFVVTPSPSSDTSIVNQQLKGITNTQNTNTQSSSNLDLASGSSVSTTNKGTSGVVSIASQGTSALKTISIVEDASVKEENVLSQQKEIAATLIDSQVSGSSQNVAQKGETLGLPGQQSSSVGSSVSLLESLNKRLGQSGTGNVEIPPPNLKKSQSSVSTLSQNQNTGLVANASPGLLTADPGIKVGDSVLSSHIISGNSGIQVTNLGVSGLGGSVTTQKPTVVSSTPTVPVSSLQTQIVGVSSSDQLQSSKQTVSTSLRKVNVISSSQEVQGSNGILLGQFAVVPSNSAGSTSSIVQPLTTSISSASLTPSGQQTASSAIGSTSFSTAQQSTSSISGDSLTSVGQLGSLPFSTEQQSDSSGSSSPSSFGQVASSRLGVFTSSAGQQQASSSSSASSSSTEQQAASGNLDVSSPVGQQLVSTDSGISSAAGIQPGLSNSDTSSTKQHSLQSSVNSEATSNVNPTINERGNSGLISPNINTPIFFGNSESPNTAQNPNVVLAIPLSLLSQSPGIFAGGRNIANPTNQGTGTAGQTPDIRQNFSFTTDPHEVLKLIQQAQATTLGSSLTNNNPFGSNFGSSGNLASSASSSSSPQASSQTSSVGQQFQGTVTQRHQPASATVSGSQSSTKTNIQNPSVSINLSHPGTTPGSPRVISVVSPSGSLTFLPETLAHLSSALGFGVPLPSPPVLTLAGKQGTGAAKTTAVTKATNRSKVGNVLKRESPHLL